ncbi:hypothetical protein H8959_014268 [Pygathrix nigripes]
MRSFLCSWAPVSILLAMGLQPENDSAKWLANPVHCEAGPRRWQARPSPRRRGLRECLPPPAALAQAHRGSRPREMPSRACGPGKSGLRRPELDEHPAHRSGSREDGPGRPLSAAAAAPAAFCVAGQAPGPHTASPGNAGALEPRKRGRPQGRRALAWKPAVAPAEASRQVDAPARSFSVLPVVLQFQEEGQRRRGPQRRLVFPRSRSRFLLIAFFFFSLGSFSPLQESGFGGTGFVTVIRLEKAPRAGREGTGAPSELLLEAVARPGKVVLPPGPRGSKREPQL